MDITPPAPTGLNGIDRKVNNMEISTLSDHITRIAKEHGLKLLYLQDIVWLHCRGHNNVEIAHRASVDRNTVNKYMLEIRRMNKNEISMLYISTILQKSSDEVITQTKKDLTGKT